MARQKPTQPGGAAAVDVQGQTFDAWRLPLKGQPESLPLLNAGKKNQEPE